MAFDSALFGAGISVPWPSSLPTGDELREIAWRGFAESLPSHHAARCAAVEQRLFHEYRGEKGLRLEQFLQVLAGAIPLKSLVQVYKIFDSVPHNRTHELIAAAEIKTILTVNMDTLLESAAKPGQAAATPVHLHGRFDAPDSVITTIRAYLDGLSDANLGALVKAVEGKRVLVAGYSARDRDIAPIILQHPPASVVWIQAPPWRLSAEARHLIAQLRRAGTTVTVEACTAEQYFDPLAPPRPSDPSPTFGVPQAYRDALESVSVTRREFALLLLMQELGMSDEIATMPFSETLDPIWAVRHGKVVARTLRRAGDYRAAARALARPPLPWRAPRAFVEWTFNINELAAVLPSAGFPRLAGAIDRALVYLLPKRWGPFKKDDRGEKVALQARVRIAQRGLSAGRLAQAGRHLRYAIDHPRARQLMGMGSYVDALTWHADILKVLGDYKEAERVIATAIIEIPYANESQRSYAVAKSAEIRVLSGGGVGTARKEFVEAIDLAVRSSDKKAEFWAHAMRASVLAEVNPRLAAESLRAARVTLPTNYRPSEAYLRLVELQHALSKKHPWAHEPDFESLMTITGRGVHGPRLHTFELAGRLLVLESPGAAEKGTRARGRALARVGRRYARLGMRGAELRSRISRSKLRGRGGARQLTVRAAEEDFPLEAAYAASGSLGDPWLPIV